MKITIIRNKPGRLALAIACLASGTAQGQQQQAPQGGKEQLAPVLITGNPLREKDPLQIGNLQLSGEALSLRRAGTLGESLDGLPGVSSTYFGPNANRPVLRGLDGDRVRMLSNSGASTDASSLSYDHAVPVDPLVIDRVEVLRGAAALLYGGNAIGGVVNTLDRRIPREPAPGSISGAAELRLGGAADVRHGAVTLDGGSTGFAWHADASARKADDLRVPGPLKRVQNSAAESHGGALGASALFGSYGYAGLSVEDYRNDYGVTVEPDVGIQMQRQRVATAGEWRMPGTALPRLSWQASRSDYEHKEVEGSGEVGTVFKSRGMDLRLEAEHGAIGPLRGVLGLQWEDSDFSALGEEALVPVTRSRSGALFLLEQYRSGPLALSLGARLEKVRVASEGDASDAAEPRFGPAQTRRFTPRSLALNSSWALSPQWSLQAQLSDTERAPMFYELFADGVHVASGAYERGDPTLGLERARGVDLGLKWQQGESLLRFNAYQTRFANYIALDATGTDFIDEEGESLPEYAYRGVPAQLTGFELEARHALPVMAWAGAWRFSTGVVLDAVRGSNRANGAPLPRLAPRRATLSLAADDGGLWRADLELRLAARQDRVPVLDTPTAGYGLLKLSLARRLQLGGLSGLWYLKLDNLGDKQARSASSMATLREISPLPGRSLLMGLQLRF